jgi:septal ring factor EnvC (AmiA/AmiB activator)
VLSPQWIVAIIAGITMVVQVLLSWSAIRWHQHYQKQQMDARHEDNQRSLARIERQLSDADEWREQVTENRGQQNAEHRDYERRLAALERRVFNGRGEP